MNLSGSGLSMSLGPRGASVSVGRRGVHANVGIPGTGLYTRQKLIGNSRITHQAEEGSSYVKVQIDRETGAVSFVDDAGVPCSAALERKVKRQYGDNIRTAMQEAANEMNEPIDSVKNVYLDTPSPESGVQVEPRKFPEEMPQEPSLETINAFLGFFARRKKKAIERSNAEKQTHYQEAMRSWRRRQFEFHEAETSRIADIHTRIRSDVNVMEKYLSERLAGISWPHETLVSYDILSEGKGVVMDVDFPEIEDLPTRVARVPQRGWKVNIKKLSDKEKRLNYAHHIHGIIFRLIGEVFSLLPSVGNVIISGYSQRPEKATGHIVDEYLISVRVERGQWKMINFENLPAVEPATALEAFDFRRNMTVTGIFKPIVPLHES